VRPPPTDAAPASTSPTLLALFLVVVSLGAACGSAAPPTGSDRFHRGVCWVAGRAVDAGDLEPLVRLHASWISQTPFGWQAEPEDTEIETATSGHVLWGESDEGLIETTRLAHARGIRVLLKPHLWLRRGWPGDIAMRREEDWRAWFASYREFILHYADLAQRAGIEALAVGTELGGTTRREAEWRALIADVRARYRGKLTYCANWSEDVEHVAFWDALDWIGVQAYYPLAENPAPTVDQLLQGWRKPVATLKALSARTKRPVLFTEVGYHALDTAASRPWEWRLEGRPSEETQARCYEALYRVAGANPWIQGVYIWKWFPRHDRAGGRRRSDYTPQGKAAERVLEREYGKIARSGR